MARERSPVDMGAIDVGGFEPKRRNNTALDRDDVAKVSRNAGFVSRSSSPESEPKPKARRRGWRSPFTAQMNVRVQPDVKDAVLDLCDERGLKVQEAVDEALRAWLREQGRSE